MIVNKDNEGWEIPDLGNELDELLTEFKKKELVNLFSDVRRIIIQPMSTSSETMTS